MAGFLWMLFLCAPVGAAEAPAAIGADAFERTVARMRSGDAKTATRSGADGITVTCTALPSGEVIGVAWEIDNPQGKALSFKPGDIRVYDRVRTFERIEPAKAAAKLYGGLEMPTPLRDPKIDSNVPVDYLMPRMRTTPRQDEDIFASSFNFVRTDARRITGMTYYRRGAARGPTGAQMTIGGQTLTLEF